MSIEESPAQPDAEAMLIHGIKFENGRYNFMGYKYDNLQDAVNYANVQAQSKYAYSTAPSEHPTTSSKSLHPSASTNRTDGIKMPNFDEDEIYAAALTELKSGTTLPGLWARAFAESDGDERKSQALYIKLRVQQASAVAKQKEARSLGNAEEEKLHLERRFLFVIESLKHCGYEAKRVGMGWNIREPLGGRVQLDSDQSLITYATGRVAVPTELINGTDQIPRLPSKIDGMRIHGDPALGTDTQSSGASHSTQTEVKSSASLGWGFWGMGISAGLIGIFFGLLGGAIFLGVWWLIDYLRKKK